VTLQRERNLNAPVVCIGYSGASFVECGSVGQAEFAVQCNECSAQAHKGVEEHSW
jgi:hypothetical protein